MARTLVAATEVIAPEGHPTFPDTVNRYLRGLDADFLQEHTENGNQIDKYELWALAEGDQTYAGTGAVQTIDFVATTFTEILALWIWSEADGELYITSVAGETIQASDGTVLDDAVTAFDEKGFTLGTGTECNTNSTTYYYLVFAIGTTPDAGSNASPPTWIADGTALEGGDSTKNANSVTDNLDTKFLVKHTIGTGAHDDSEFDNLARGEKGSFVVSGVAAQIITLDNTDLVIQSLFLYIADELIAFIGENFTSLRDFSTTALTSTKYVVLETGQFRIDGTKMKPSNTTILDINSDNANGDTNIVDSSDNAHYIFNPGSPTSGILEHSTTQHHSGASSIKIPNAGAGIGYILISASDAGSVVLLGDFDIEFELWIPTGDTMASDASVFLWFDNLIDLNADTSAYIRIEIQTNHKVKVSIRDDDTDSFNVITLSSTTALDDSTWHNVKLSRVSGACTLDIDSSTEATATILGQFLNLNYMHLGLFDRQYQAGTTWYIDDIQIDVREQYFKTGETVNYTVIGED